MGCVCDRHEVGVCAERAGRGETKHPVAEGGEHARRRRPWARHLVHHVEVATHPCERTTPFDPATFGRVRVADADAEHQPPTVRFTEEGGAAREHLRLSRRDVGDPARDGKALARPERPPQVGEDVVGAAAFGEPERRVAHRLDRAHIGGDAIGQQFIEGERPRSDATECPPQGLVFSRHPRSLPRLRSPTRGRRRPARCGRRAHR